MSDCIYTYVPIKEVGEIYNSINIFPQKSAGACFNNFIEILYKYKVQLENNDYIICIHNFLNNTQQIRIYEILKCTLFCWLQHY